MRVVEVFPEEYEARVRRHLEQYKPKLSAEFKTTGYFEEYVQNLAEQIANWVNSQLPSEEQLQGLPQAERTREKEARRLSAESDAMRELLPRDEESESLIGPSGGYEDPVDSVDSLDIDE